MDLIKNFFLNLILVFNQDTLCISLANILVILFFLIFALIIRGVIAKLLVKNKKRLVSKTVNDIDDKLFDSSTST